MLSQRSPQPYSGRRRVGRGQNATRFPPLDRRVLTSRWHNTSDGTEQAFLKVMISHRLREIGRPMSIRRAETAPCREMNRLHFRRPVYTSNWYLFPCSRFSSPLYLDLLPTSSIISGMLLANIACNRPRCRSRKASERTRTPSRGARQCPPESRCTRYTYYGDAVI